MQAHIATISSSVCCDRYSSLLQNVDGAVDVMMESLASVCLLSKYPQFSVIFYSSIFALLLVSVPHYVLIPEVGVTCHEK